MSTSRIETFGAHPATVFESLLDAADDGELRAHIIDQRRYEVVINREGKSWRLSASVTDNGLGESILHMSWQPRGSKGASKSAKRLTKQIRRTLERMAPPA